jgi:hypothetical protein
MALKRFILLGLVLTGIGCGKSEFEPPGGLIEDSSTTIPVWECIPPEKDSYQVVAFEVLSQSCPGFWGKPFNSVDLKGIQPPMWEEVCTVGLEEQADIGLCEWRVRCTAPHALNAQSVVYDVYRRLTIRTLDDSWTYWGQAIYEVEDNSPDSCYAVVRVTLM